MKCDSCGKFRRDEDIIGIMGENDESWTECFYCCSPHDRKTYFGQEILKSELEIKKPKKKSYAYTDGLEIKWLLKDSEMPEPWERFHDADMEKT